MTKLVEVTSDFNVEFDLRYATSNNVCKKVLYQKTKCFLHPEAAEKLRIAVKIAKELGYKIKIFDGYRPLSVQQFMFDSFPVTEGEEGFISDPKTGSIPHCRGIAIDLTLLNSNNQEIDMGSDFDEFSSLAFHDYQNISNDVKKNRQILLTIMTKAGFDFYSKEWWHYQLFQPRTYEIVDNFDHISAVI